MRKILLLLLLLSNSFAFVVKPYPKKYIFFSDSDIKIVFEIKLDSINEDLKIEKKTFPSDAILLDVKNCISCRSKLYKLIFLWHPLPYEVGNFQPVIEINKKETIKFNLIIKPKRKNAGKRY